MFKSLAEVISEWDSKYNESEYSQDQITTPGYSEIEIGALEDSLGIEFHPSLKQMLQRVKLTARFINASFGSGNQLEYLFSVNDPAWGSREGNYLQIGATDGYFFFLDNATGEIYVYEGGSPAQPELAADTLEEFVCIVASIANNRKRDLEREQALQEIRSFLDKNAIQNVRQFWIDLALGYA